MGRTKLTPKRLMETRKTNIGHIIIFCEGKTEKFYFDYFAEIIKKNKYTDIEIVLENVGGNAQTVLNFANSFMEVEEHNRKFSVYEKYLVFDCDDPPNIQAVIQFAKQYELLISNHLFEIWLLMHFENVKSKLSKRETYRRLSGYLVNDYSKGHRGKTREIIQNGDVEKAIDNAMVLEKRYINEGRNTLADINEMNPYTSVYKLVEQFMVEISGYGDRDDIRKN